MSSKRDELRAASLAASQTFRSKVLKIDGHEFEFREPSIGAWSDIIRKSTDEKSQIVYKDFFIYVLIECCYVPGGKEKVFESGDYDTIVASPRGSIFQKLNEHAMELFNVDAEEVAGKNSDKTDSNAGNLKLVNG